LDDDVVTLINFYEENCILHDVSHPEYSNKVKKRALENELAEMLQKPGKQRRTLFSHTADFYVGHSLVVHGSDFRY